MSVAAACAHCGGPGVSGVRTGAACPVCKRPIRQTIVAAGGAGPTRNGGALRGNAEAPGAPGSPPPGRYDAKAIASTTVRLGSIADDASDRPTPVSIPIVTIDDAGRTIRGAYQAVTGAGQHDRDASNDLRRGFAPPPDAARTLPVDAAVPASSTLVIEDVAQRSRRPLGTRGARGTRAALLVLAAAAVVGAVVAWNGLTPRVGTPPSAIRTPLPASGQSPTTVPITSPPVPSPPVLTPPPPESSAPSPERRPALASKDHAAARPVDRAARPRAGTAGPAVRPAAANPSHALGVPKRSVARVNTSTKERKRAGPLKSAGSTIKRTGGDEGDAEDRAKQVYQRGNEHLFAGDVEAAIAAYKDAISASPRETAGYRGLGLAYAQQGNAAQSVRTLREYLKRAPTAPDAALIRQRIELLERR